MNICNAAASILQRGVELDTNQRYTEAFICYQEGLQLLVEVIKEESGEKKNYLRLKCEEYMHRAEEIKKLIAKLKNEGKYHEQMTIKENSTGHSYEKIFGRFLDDEVKSIEIEDPYIRTFHQCQNLVRVCEVFVKKCKFLSSINLTTTRGKENAEQGKWFGDLKTDLFKHKVCLTVTYSDSLHDRQIILGNGWIIKIGRGLDYFKAPANKFSLGFFDLDLRPCQETTVDVFHSHNVKTVP